MKSLSNTSIVESSKKWKSFIKLWRKREQKRDTESCGIAPQREFSSKFEGIIMEDLTPMLT